jgi:hypothetical protein
MSPPLTAELIELLKRERLCLECLARRAGRRPDLVARALEALGGAVRLSQQPALCASCGSVRISYKIQ